MSKGGSNVQTPNPTEYMPLVQQSADVNRLNQFTPFGNTQYVEQEQPTALSFEEWGANNPGQPKTLDDGRNAYMAALHSGEIGPETSVLDYLKQNPGMASQGVSRTGYDAYLAQFEKDNPYVQPDVVQELSPELQSIFTQQFDPNAYQNYADDYMANATRLLDPIYDRQQERFQQQMANRGMPVGAEYYDDAYGNLMDAQNRGYEDASFRATQAGEQARLQDFNRLMSAMGGSQVAYPGVDTMGAANMAMNAGIANQQSADQRHSDLWGTVGNVGSAATMASIMSSKDYKEGKKPVNTLSKLNSIPVERWKYKQGIADGGEHIGPYAEDFKEAFGLGDGKTINLIDAVGVLMRSVQELSAEVKALRSIHG